METVKNLYETDFNLWLEETARLLKENKFEQLDIENLIEEIEAVGRSEKKGFRSNLEILLLHLLKWKYQQNQRSGSWERSIIEHRNRVLDELQDSPSYKPYYEQIFNKCYQNARKYAEAETGLSIKTFPEICPFSKIEVLTIDYLPEDNKNKIRLGSEVHFLFLSLLLIPPSPLNKGGSSISSGKGRQKISNDQDF